MFKAQESPPADYLTGPRGADLLDPAEWEALCEEALARDAALSAGGPVITWDAFEAWVRSRLTQRVQALSPSPMSGA